MDIILLAKILAALEWKFASYTTNSMITYVNFRYPEILTETHNEFNHLYLEL